MKALALNPRMSEKAYSLSEEHNTYVFDVPAQANKQMVAEAVAVQYQVSVDSVRIAKTAAKTRRSIKRRGRNIYRGESSGIRKAYVRLAKDQTLPIFAADKEAEAKAEKVQQTAEKAIAKETQKEGKTRRGFFGRKASDRTSIRGNK